MKGLVSYEDQIFLGEEIKPGRWLKISVKRVPYMKNVAWLTFNEWIFEKRQFLMFVTQVKKNTGLFLEFMETLGTRQRSLSLSLSTTTVCYMSSS